MVLGRASELKYLNAYYDREGSRIVVVYGKKNIGKTALLDQFVQDKPYSYYRARAASGREQCCLWGAEIARDGNKITRYPSFAEIFQALADDTTENKVIIIDEFQYIVRADNEFMKELTAFANNNSHVMVILCSSSIGWIENSMITRIGEAAHELSGFLKIRELGFETIMEYFPGFSMEQCIEVYAVLGGMPGLWAHFDDKLSIRQNICRHILDKNSFLYSEGQRIVEEELRETSVYNTILSAIAAGKHKLNDLFLHTGFSRAKISVYLKNLMELELVEKVFSYDTEGKANAQKGIYRITNHFVHFYFSFLYPNLSRLETLTEEQFYTEYIAPSIRGYVGEYFKTVCKQHIEKLSKWKRLPIEVDRIGEWVGKFGNIDLIAQDEEGKTLIGICNWDKPMMRYDDYEWLLFCARKAKIHVDYIYLFSVGRFEEKLDLEAKVKRNLKLIRLDEM